MSELDRIVRDVEAAPPAPNNGAGDEPPKREGLNFPNPSGRHWEKDEKKAPPARPVEEKPEEEKPKEKPLTRAQRRSKLEKKLGAGYMGFALFVKKAQGYPGDVLISQSEEFVDSVMALAEEKPRVMEWLESATEIGVYGRLFAFGTSITLPILAYYGFFPEEFVNILVAKDWLSVPPVPPDEE